MILNNYRAWRAWLDNSKMDDYAYSSVVNIGLKNRSGATVTKMLGYSTSEYLNYAAISRSFKAGIGCVLGAGDNELSPMDYNVSNDITSNFSSMSLSLSIAGTEEKVSRIITITGSNSSNADKTITEVGIYKTIYTYDSNSGNKLPDYIMFAITKLDEPIVVPSGSGFTITLEWTEQ